MARSKDLGFFWGETDFYIVEGPENLPRVVPVAVSSVGESDGTAVDDVRITALIQKGLREARISSTQVKLSVSSGVIVRSFLLPWMKAGEVSGAVEFEVKKYLPFSLKDLSYAYHPVPVTQEKIKKLRIVFVAVRRDFLERCTRILEQAGLNVVFSEPAPLSLVRALLAKKIIPADQIIAVLHIESTAARILFTHEGMVPFIREFHLKAPNSNVSPDDPQLIKTRLLNEMHNSLEFYSREYARQRVTQVVVLSPDPGHPYGQWLKDDLDITVTSVDPASIAGGQNCPDPIGVLNALGAALAVEGRSRIVFNLSRKAVPPSALMSAINAFDIRQYMKAVKTAVVCALALTGIFALGQSGLSRLQKSEQDLTARQGNFVDMPVDDVQSKIDKNDLKLKGYKNIVLKSDSIQIFAHIPALLPEGVWLVNFNVKSAAPAGRDGPAQARWIVELGGYAYAQDPKQEIRLVHELIGRIKKERRLARFFTNVNLKNIQSQDMDGRTVVSFNQICT
ncbi:MAG: pilus assembly protein PilM [Candidatus Omnitrophica bacterium]|nr:pilus assembly protein PilM [Candidatus Omnitrophota bacterium]